jgi:hypothetical protein
MRQSARTPVCAVRAVTKRRGEHRSGRASDHHAGQQIAAQRHALNGIVRGSPQRALQPQQHERGHRHREREPFEEPRLRREPGGGERDERRSRRKREDAAAVLLPEPEAVHQPRHHRDPAA